jgi:hypothetical protein
MQEADHNVTGFLRQTQRYQWKLNRLQIELLQRFVNPPIEIKIFPDCASENQLHL